MADNHSLVPSDPYASDTSDGSRSVSTTFSLSSPSSRSSKSSGSRKGSRKESSRRSRKESSRPERKESTRPGRKESTHPERKESTRPGRKESTHPERKESTRPGRKESTHPERKESTHPERKESTRPGRKESTQPGRKESTQPERKESTHPERKESTRPGRKESTHPERKESTHPERKESTRPGRKESTQPERKESTHPQRKESTRPESTLLVWNESKRPHRITSAPRRHRNTSENSTKSETPIQVVYPAVNDQVSVDIESDDEDVVDRALALAEAKATVPRTESEDIALAIRLQEEEVQQARRRGEPEERARREELLREHIQAPALADSTNKFDKAVETIKSTTRSKWDDFKFAAHEKSTVCDDRMQAFVTKHDNPCTRGCFLTYKTVRTLFSPVRMRTDSDVARDLSRSSLSSMAYSSDDSKLTKQDRKLAERMARQLEREAREQEQRDREIATELHGQEVERVENRMLRQQFGTLARLGSVDFMKPKQHYPYFCRLMSLFLILMMVVEIIVNGGFEPLGVNATFGPSIETMVKMGAKKTDLILENGEWYRLVVPMFLHAGVLHLGFNLLGLNNIGAPAEREYGSLKIATIYFTSGLFGVIMSAVFIPSIVSVGASGAIFGLFGACWADLIQNWSLYRDNAKKVLSQLTFMTLLNLILGLLPFIDNFQHLGGMICGFFAGLGLLVHKRYSISGRLKAQKDYQVFLKWFSRFLMPFFIGLGLVLLYQVDNAATECEACAYISCVPMPPGVAPEDRWWNCDACSLGSIFEAELATSGEGQNTVRVTCLTNGDSFTDDSDDITAETSQAVAQQLCRDHCL